MEKGRLVEPEAGRRERDDPPGDAFAPLGDPRPRGRERRRCGDQNEKDAVPPRWQILLACDVEQGIRAPEQPSGG